MNKLHPQLRELARLLFVDDAEAFLGMTAREVIAAKKERGFR